MLILNIVLFISLDISEMIMSIGGSTKKDSETVIKMIRINNCMIIGLTVMDLFQFLSLDKNFSPFVDIFY